MELLKRVQSDGNQQTEIRVDAVKLLIETGKWVVILGLTVYVGNRLGKALRDILENNGTSASSLVAVKKGLAKRCR